MFNFHFNPFIKSILIVIICILSFSTLSISQAFQQDQVIRIGYRLGTERFYGAYRSFNQIGSAGGSFTYSLNTEYNDNIRLSNYEVWYGRFSKNAFYEANIDGMINAIAMLASSGGPDFKWLFEKFRHGEKNTNEKPSAIDYDILNFKLAFGAHGIYLGGQLKSTRLGYFGGTVDNNVGGLHVLGFTFSEENMGAYGLGLHANLATDAFTVQNHLMFNWIKGGKDAGAFFKGKEIEFESTISLGKELGLYVTPFFKKRFANSLKRNDDFYGNTNTGAYRGLNSTFAFGIKLGFYIASEADEGDCYISVAD